ncbi:7,8-didemethyl-8-hydroxy-5-deazariboflavin synthase CofG [Microbacterium sediminis]|uniref:7,8-didemethyl-8-hydroxy-5-deazariboflavin synthase n=1 Tax=Microbacterium sediminis TaxID=904291 RepID=A0A1B9NE16_9MICO|nr:7,8-didemethyl-8-hydroxy-5-deazariboflavin synthase CofG [Microbacterium sediminis]OCG74837.1 2-phospho-L-lactate guanylyltransferase [Microbacterium sediminis]QBR75139.1 7,8-didemethyl-8-hydroxy-5-deazariboflavin synthase subunit CofG [Microbacterium sediminis]
MTLIDPVPAVAPALERAARGERLDVDDALALLSTEGAEAARVRELAARMRDEGLAAAGRPGVITYSRKVFIPLTTLCRDRCHYCVFVDTPGQLLKKHKPTYMSEEQVLAVARRGAAMGCKEALLTLGDRPEDRWPEARAWLDEHGYASTLEYVGAMARLITAETGLLAHLNPGVMSPAELEMLRPTAPSMGVMLETTSRRVFEEPGQVHYGSPDKDPAVRLKLLANAGEARIPFTTGILIGIGETLRDRAESMIALRDAAERGGHIQEIIVQNFRAKPRTAAAGAPDASLREYVAAVAVTRLVMGPRMRVQVPPNLSDPTEFGLLVEAGIDDWGGVSPLTADHVNPERPWPHLDDLAAATAALGFTLRERLTAHPEYVRDPEWIDPALRPAVLALAGADGLAVEGLRPQGSSTDASDANAAETGREEARRGHDAAPVITSGSTGLIAAVIDRAAQDPSSLDDAEWERLLLATGDDLEALVHTADDVRRYTVGEAISIVANRNVSSSAFRSAGGGAATVRAAGLQQDGEAYDLAQLADAVRDAWDLGLSELCVQGPIDPAESPEAYLDIARAVKHAAPGMHLHAYRPQDVVDLADRSGLGLAGALTALREAGVDSVPGTGIKLASERVRGLLAPGDLEIDRWIEAITAAHEAGFSSTSVMFYGHVETAGERIAHLRTLLGIQARTGGFAEFVPIPLPGPAGGVGLLADRSPVDEHRAMVAVSRLMLGETIRHIQIPWTRHDRATTAELLRSGGDDLGGTLLDGRVLPRAGIEAGQELPLAEARRLAQRLFRPLRLRTTTYGEPTAERKAAAEAGAAGSAAARGGSAP